MAGGPRLVAGQGIIPRGRPLPFDLYGGYDMQCDSSLIMAKYHFPKVVV